MSGYKEPMKLAEQTPAREPQVTTTLRMLGNRIDDLEKMLVLFEGRLSVVLSAPTPTKANEAAIKAPELVPLAQELATFVYRVEDVNDRLQTLFDRVEL